MNACKQSEETETTSKSEQTTVETTSTSTMIAYEFDEEDFDDSYEEATSTIITLSSTTASVKGDGASVKNGVVTIHQAGTYIVSGTLSDGQLVVDATSSDTVRIVLKDANITSSTASGIYVKQADKTVLILAKDSVNTITDASNYTYDDVQQEEPNAAIFSKDDLTIAGSGSLVVKGNFNHGIFTKNDLVITNGTYEITSVNDGIKGKDSIAIADGTFQIKAGGDGLQSSEDTETGKGFVYIQSGSFVIEATGDGIQAETSLEVNGGTYQITTGGGSGTASTSSNWGNWNTSSTTEDETSAKGIKAGQDMQIKAGTFTLNTSDDAIHANANVTIQDGTFTIESGDDGIHADETLTVEQGNLNVTKSYEGLEGNALVINGGVISITSSDDGLNAAGGNDGSSVNGRPGENSFSGASGSASITINGGELYVCAQGDGLDSNGSLYIKGGTIFVDGPSSDGNGSLDYDGTCEINGGVLMCAGRSGMAQMPGSSSTQNAVMVSFSSYQSAGTQINIEQDGTLIASMTPTISFNCIIVSTPTLTSDTFTLSKDGSITNAQSIAHASVSGSISGSTKLTEFSISSVTTSINDSGASVSAGGQGGPGQGGMKGGGRP